MIDARTGISSHGDALFSEEHPLTIYTFPYAGGNALSYHQWPFPSAIRWVNLDYPGHGLRRKEALLPSLDALARDAASRILNSQEENPTAVALFGHSMGGICAWRTAQLLQKELPVIHLFVSACPAPDIFPPPGQPIETDADTLAFLDHFHQLPPKVLNNPRFRAHGLPAITHDIRLSNAWVCPDWQPLACPISAFAGNRDTLAPRSAMERWNSFTGGVFTFRTFDGAHFYFENPQSLTALTAAICNDLI